uniref:Uncharacterized protein MANES_15G013800 n=1 Tax=Rhizophora mucronata TaxID=61149 RepID=A0A2P2MWD9_RHIMU
MNSSCFSLKDGNTVEVMYSSKDSLYLSYNCWE